MTQCNRCGSAAWDRFHSCAPGKCPDCGRTERPKGSLDITDLARHAVVVERHCAICRRTESKSPPSFGGVCAIATDVLTDLGGDGGGYAHVQCVARVRRKRDLQEIRAARRRMVEKLKSSAKSASKLPQQKDP